MKVKSWTEETLIFDNGKVVGKNNSHHVQVFWPNGQEASRAHFVNGHLHYYICWNQDGTRTVSFGC